jgi:phosphohistidine phosphatase
MKRTLILLRHAKSAWPEDVPDTTRPLAERGRRDAPAIGRWLRGQIPKIDLVLCSPAVRAIQTWDLAALQLDSPPRVQLDERLYEASTERLLTVAQKLPGEASTVVFVGHNPTLEEFLELLTGVAKLFKTSTIAVMTTPVTWNEAKAQSWTLEMLTTPRGQAGSG